MDDRALRIKVQLRIKYLLTLYIHVAEADLMPLLN